MERFGLKRAFVLNKIDLIAFIGAALLGAFFIIVLKHRVPQIYVTAAVCSLVVAYSVAMVWFERLHLRLDQAADNAYYLGLVFTLTSMARALWDVGQATASADGHVVRVAEVIIGDFGVALASTLFGIVCRLVLQQMRMDPADVEKVARIELAGAATRMRATLNSVTSDIGEFHAILGQKHQDYVHELEERYKALADRSALQFGELASASAKHLDEAGQQVATASQRVAESTLAFSSASEKVTESFEKASERLLAVEAPPVALGKAFERIATKIESAGSQIESSGEQVAAHMGKLRQIGTLLNEASAGLLHAISNIGDRDSRRDRQFSEFEERVRSQLDSLQQTTQQLHLGFSSLAQGATDSVGAVQVMEESLKATLDGLTQLVNMLVSGLDRKLANGLERRLS